MSLDLPVGLSRTGFVWHFPAVVDHVHDGDSVICHVLWRAHEVGHEVNVRVEGINAIELRKLYGGQARDALAAYLPRGEKLTLHHRRADKYSGRFLARIVRDRDHGDAGAHMLQQVASDGSTPLAVPYNP